MWPFTKNGHIYFGHQSCPVPIGGIDNFLWIKLANRWEYGTIPSCHCYKWCTMEHSTMYDQPINRVQLNVLHDTNRHHCHHHATFGIGIPLGNYHPNQLLDTREYRVELEDSTSYELYFANTIAKNVWSQCNSEGWQFNIIWLHLPQVGWPHCPYPGRFQDYQQPTVHEVDCSWMEDEHWIFR